MDCQKKKFAKPKLTNSMVSIHNLVIKFTAAFTEFEVIFLKSIIRMVLILFIFLSLFFFPSFFVHGHPTMIFNSDDNI